MSAIGAVVVCWPALSKTSCPSSRTEAVDSVVSTSAADIFSLTYTSPRQSTTNGGAIGDGVLSHERLATSSRRDTGAGAPATPGPRCATGAYVPQRPCCAIALPLARLYFMYWYVRPGPVVMVGEGRPG